MYISGTSASAPGYPRVQPRQDRPAQSEAPATSRNAADASRRAPAVRVVEGEVLSGRVKHAANDGLHRYVHTLRGMVEGGHDQSIANNSAQRAIQAYLDNSMSPAEADAKRSPIIDFMI